MRGAVCQGVGGVTANMCVAFDACVSDDEEAKSPPTPCMHACIYVWLYGCVCVCCQVLARAAFYVERGDLPKAVTELDTLQVGREGGRVQKVELFLCRQCIDNEGLPTTPPFPPPSSPSPTTVSSLPSLHRRHRSYHMTT